MLFNTSAVKDEPNDNEFFDLFECPVPPQQPLDEFRNPSPPRHLKSLTHNVDESGLLFYFYFFF